MNLEISEKRKFLEEKGMKTNELEFDQLEIVYNVVINNQNTLPIIEKNKYQKINWKGNDQLQVFLDMINKFKVCKKIKNNSNSLEILIYSIFEANDNFYIHLNPQIILKKIKKRCDLFITSDTWITEDFIKKSKNKYIWIGNIDNEIDFKKLKDICSLVLNDHMDLQKVL